jgi:O-antigen ligase
MKTNSLTTRVITVSVITISVILVLMPFHAFLTVWFSSVVGHYTALRLWKEVLLLGLIGVSIYLLLSDKKLRSTFLKSKLHWLIGAYISVICIWGGIAYVAHGVTLKALSYGLIVDTRFLLFFLAVSVIVAAKPKVFENWPKLIFIPAGVVVLIGLLQYFVFSYDILKHFGYNDATIFPYATINHNVNYIRIMSTLRGANPLGAYLLVILSLLGASWLKVRAHWKLVLGAVSLLVLILTFSRSAWIGLVIATLVLTWFSLKSEKSKRVAGISAAVCAVFAIVIALVLHDNSAFQNTFFHTSDHSTIKTSSNEGHVSALKNGLKDVGQAPWGHGTGTAGPASVYNSEHGTTKISENFFVQIAQEVGIVGLALFLAIQAYVGRELWRRRADPLALGLLAALVGLSFVNLLSHAWADDTLAYIFWGLAAMALTSKVPKTKKI